MQRPPSHQFNQSQFYPQGQQGQSQPASGPQTINPAALNFPNTNVNTAGNMSHNPGNQGGMPPNKFSGMTPQMLALYSQRIAASQQQQLQMQNQGQQMQNQSVPGQVVGRAQQGPPPSSQGFNPSAFQLPPQAHTQNQQGQQPQQVCLSDHLCFLLAESFAVVYKSRSIDGRGNAQSL